MSRIDQEIEKLTTAVAYLRATGGAGLSLAYADTYEHVLVDAENSLEVLRSQLNEVIELPSKAHSDYLLERHGIVDVHRGHREALKKFFGVKYLMVGELKVKETSSLIYKGLILPVLGYYMKWPDIGRHSDGWDEYRVSLVGYGFDNDETNIDTGDIEWIKAEPWDGK